MELKGFAKELFEALKQELGSAYDDTSPEVRKAVIALALDTSKIGIRKLQGEDVAREVVILKATAANLGWVAEDKAIKAVQNAAVKASGSIIGTLIGFV